jgi:hypothetical protein
VVGAGVAAWLRIQESQALAAAERSGWARKGDISITRIIIIITIIIIIIIIIRTIRIIINAIIIRIIIIIIIIMLISIVIIIICGRRGCCGVAADHGQPGIGRGREV